MQVHKKYIHPKDREAATQTMWVFLLKLVLVALIFLLGLSVATTGAVEPSSNHNLVSDLNNESSLMNQPPQPPPQHRRLQQETATPDLSSYSLKFTHCRSNYMDVDETTVRVQSVEGFVKEQQHDGQQFVIFRLCRDHDCTTCNVNYGEYMIDLEAYLQLTSDYILKKHANMCKECREQCGDDRTNRRHIQESTVDCYTCLDICLKIDNMNANGYIDAFTFIECAMIYDPNDDSLPSLMAGPQCADRITDWQGNERPDKIKIGVFRDASCRTLDPSKDVDDYLVSQEGYMMRLSHAFLKETYTDTCFSCQDGFCDGLYQQASRCEQAHGFEQSTLVDRSDESAVCDMIQKLKLDEPRPLEGDAVGVALNEDGSVGDGEGVSSASNSSGLPSSNARILTLKKCFRLSMLHGMLYYIS